MKVIKREEPIMLESDSFILRTIGLDEDEYLLAFSDNKYCFFSYKSLSAICMVIPSKNYKTIDLSRDFDLVYEKVADYFDDDVAYYSDVIELDVVLDGVRSWEQGKVREFLRSNKR